MVLAKRSDDGFADDGRIEVPPRIRNPMDKSGYEVGHADTCEQHRAQHLPTLSKVTGIGEGGTVTGTLT